ncbi:MAG: hypothetical protein METHAR1v1_540004, partial [Methanothrix sp.]
MEFIETFKIALLIVGCAHIEIQKSESIRVL